MDTDEVQKELAPTTQTDSGNTIVAFRDKWCAGVGTHSGANVLIRSSHAMSANNLFQRVRIISFVRRMCLSDCVRQIMCRFQFVLESPWIGDNLDMFGCRYVVSVHVNFRMFP